MPEENKNTNPRKLDEALLYVIRNITLKAILKIPLYNHFMFQLLKPAPPSPKPTDDVIREWRFHALSSSFKMVASLIAAFVWL